MENPVDRVIRFVRETAYDSLPPEVRHQAARALLDAFGALIAGTRAPVAGIMARLASTHFAGTEATLLATGARASIIGAALANGFAANALAIDDGYRLVKGHPGACVLPVVLAAAEKIPASNPSSLSRPTPDGSPSWAPAIAS